jgi:hypothetical protein
MDRRRNPRVSARLPVRIWGMDVYLRPFMQLATAMNISRNGALIQGMRRQVRPGEILEVQLGHEKAQFCVTWVGKLGSRKDGENRRTNAAFRALHLGRQPHPMHPVCHAARPA